MASLCHAAPETLAGNQCLVEIVLGKKEAIAAELAEEFLNRAIGIDSFNRMRVEGLHLDRVLIRKMITAVVVEASAFSGMEK